MGRFPTNTATKTKFEAACAFNIRNQDSKKWTGAIKYEYLLQCNMRNLIGNDGISGTNRNLSSNHSYA